MTYPVQYTEGKHLKKNSSSVKGIMNIVLLKLMFIIMIICNSNSNKKNNNFIYNDLITFIT